MNLANVSLNITLVQEGRLKVSQKCKDSGKALARNSVKVKLWLLHGAHTRQN